MLMTVDKCVLLMIFFHGSFYLNCCHVKKMTLIVTLQLKFIGQSPNHHHHWAAVVSRGWAKALACRLHVSLSCAVLCQIVSLQNLSRSSFHRLADLPCRLFLSYHLQLMTCKVHRSSLKRYQFIFFHIADYMYYCCLLPDPYEHWSFYI